MPHSLTTTRRAALAWISALAALGALAACRHVTFVSPYDEATDKGATAIHGQVDALLTQLDRDPVPAYGSLKPSYDAIHADISSLRLRNEARPKNELTVKQIDALESNVSAVEEQHRTGALNQAMVAPARDILNQTFRAILTLELAKKELPQ
jgi:hypothetical protein